MRSALFFQVLLNILFALILLVMGILIVLFPYSSELQQLWAVHLEQYSWLPTFCGLSFLIIGLIVLSRSFPLLTKSHFETVSGMLKVWVDEGIIEKELTHFWKATFDTQDLNLHAYLVRNKLHITCDIPKRERTRKERKHTLEALKKELSQFLYKRFAYNKEFCLSVNYTRDSKSLH